MAELKLRAWNTIVKRMQYFDLPDIENQKDKIQWHILKIMLYTNKKDKNETEIYSGDIIEFDAMEWGSSDNIFIVEWDDHNASWNFGGGCVSDMQFRTVIGNIYENPELIPK